MQLLSQLVRVSSYRPKSGYSLDILRMVEAGVERKEAIRRWEEMGRSAGSFYKAYKVLKDDLIRLAFVERRNSSDIEGRKMEVWEKYAVVKKLLVSQDKMAAVELAIELVKLARKVGATEVVAGMAGLLENHFGVIDFDHRRYKRYRYLRQKYSQWLYEESEVMALQARLVATLKRGEKWQFLMLKMRDLIERPDGSFTYMRFRFSVLSIWFDLNKDFHGLYLLFRETAAFYEHCDEEIPATVLTALYSRFSAHLAAHRLYPNASVYISKGLGTVKEGTAAWHRLMLQKACIGLISGKFGVARICLKKVGGVKNSHGNPEIEIGWNTVRKLMESGGEMGFERVWGAVFDVV